MHLRWQGESYTNFIYKYYNLNAWEGVGWHHTPLVYIHF